jgi:gliding motility-associated-like protein
LVISFVLSQINILTAQTNLVPNPSFESYIGCPLDQAELYRAVPWFTPNQGTSDYYNICNTSLPGSNFDVPTNLPGFQYARTGVAYAGAASNFNTPSFDNREYIEVKLTEALKKDFRYSIEFYVSLTNTSTVAIDAIGAFLGDSLVDFTNFTRLNATPQINNPSGNILKDTLNWMKISGVMKSEGGERFLTIGNFITNSENTIDTLDHSVGIGYGAYYYIDDVSVVCLNCDSDTVTTAPNNLFIPDAFSPNGDGNNDKLFVRGNNIQELYFAVYDRWGEKVFETTDKNNGWDGTYKGSSISGAVFVYYCKGKYTDGKEFKQKGDVTLVR